MNRMQDFTGTHPLERGDAPTRRGFRAGVWAAMPVLLAVVPFGLIFGTIATEAGFDLVQTMAFTTLVIAGASQLASLQLLADGAPVAVAVLTGAVVNLRMAMYSATLAVNWQGVGMLWRVPAAFFLHDQSFALSMNHYRARPDESPGDRIGFYFGVGFLTCVVWVAATWLGTVVGSSIPEGWGLEFAAPATFLAVAAPMIRGTANIAAAAVSATLSVIFAGLPGGFGLMIAAAGGIATGMATRRLLPGRAR